MWWDAFRFMARPIFALLISLIVGISTSKVVVKVGKWVLDFLVDYGKILVYCIVTLVVTVLFMTLAMNEVELLDSSMDHVSYGVDYGLAAASDAFQHARGLLCEKSRYMPRKWCFNVLNITMV